MKISDIEKVFTFSLKGYDVKIERNKRKDCFLSIRISNPEPYEHPEVLICNGSRLHMTLKSAKNTAIKIIESFEK